MGGLGGGGEFFDIKKIHKITLLISIAIFCCMEFLVFLSYARNVQEIYGTCPGHVQEASLKFPGIFSDFSRERFPALSWNCPANFQ